MGILSLFSKSDPSVQRLPNGSLTVDRNASLVATTISSSFDPDFLEGIGRQILALFREARKAQMPLAEIHLHFGSLQITARELRGGAVVFFKPKDSFSDPS